MISIFFLILSLLCQISADQKKPEIGTIEDLLGTLGLNATVFESTTTKSITAPIIPVIKKSLVVAVATRPTKKPSTTESEPTTAPASLVTPTTPSTSTNPIFDEKSVPPKRIEPPATIAAPVKQEENVLASPAAVPTTPESTQEEHPVKAFLAPRTLVNGVIQPPSIYFQNDSKLPKLDDELEDQLANNTIVATTSQPTTVPLLPPAGILGFLAQLGAVPDSATIPITTTTTTTTVSAMVEIIYEDVEIHPEVVAHVHPDLIFHEKLDDHQKGTVSITGNKTVV